MMAVLGGGASLLQRTLGRAGDAIMVARGHDPLAEDISATLESIRWQLEEGSGKVKTHPRRSVRASGRETAKLQTRCVREIRF
jgi:hypothetical protein